jgi:hypothetical protein
LSSITIYGDITFVIVNPAAMVRKLISLPHALIAAVEDFRFKNRIKTESEAIRRLIEAGLTATDAVTSDQLVSYCRRQQRPDLADVIEALTREVQNPSDAPLMHSFPFDPRRR